MIRDLMAANAALDDIKAVGRGAPDQIAHIRKLYMSNTGLPLDQETYGIDNSKIILASYLGLLQIGILQKEDEKMLCRYMLHMFATGEEIVYKELLPSFYQSCFWDICEAIVAKYDQRKQNWKNERDLIRIYSAGQVVNDVMQPKAVEFFVPVMRVRKVIKEVGVFLNAGNSQECREYVCRCLDYQCGKEIAQTCAKQAEQLLSGSVYLQK